MLGFGLLQRSHVEPDASDQNGFAVLVEHERGADTEPNEPAVGRTDLAVVRIVAALPDRLCGDSLDPPSILFVDVREQGILEQRGRVAEDALRLLADVRESIRAPVVLGHDRVDRSDELLETLVGRLDRRTCGSVGDRHLVPRSA